MKLSDYVMQFVARQGVKHVFLVPGGGAMHLNDSLGRCRELTYVCNLHEQASAIAAENYAKMTGNLGVALVTTGPGGTNAVTGVAGAWLDSTPCLFISGQVKRSDMKRDLGVRQVGVQEVDITAIVAPITKYAVAVTDPATIRYHLEKAAFLARSGRPGPVWIDIPLDVQAATIDPERLLAFPATERRPSFDPDPLPADVRAAIGLLNRAERPVLLLGNGVRLAGATDDFLRLAEALNVPVLSTWLAIDLIPEAHPLFMGRPGSVAPRGANFTLQNCDCLIAVGARLDMVVTAYAPERMARAARKVMVDIDPTELRKLGALIDVPVHADARAFIREMLRQRESVERRDRGAWLARCREWKATYPVVLPEHRKPEGRVSVYHLSEVLGEELSGDDLIVSGSSGAGIEVFLLAYEVRKGQRIFHTTALGAMGFGPPASIGACVGGGGRRTVCVDGDGGFQFNIQELETVRRLNLPIKFFVLNNDGYASIRASQSNWFEGRLVGADATSGLTLPDVLEVASAYGLSTARIADQANLGQQVREVLAMPGPVVCEVMAIPDETRAPRVASAQRPDGAMVSRPLEDLFPFLDRAEFRANMIVPPLED
jgi:acetolactate synthase-1/2/3 large subunit